MDTWKHLIYALSN